MISLKNKKWQLHHHDSAGTLKERLCRSKGIEADHLARYTMPNPHDQLHDPMLLHDMQRACERIEAAIAAKERIVVFGDYDVDGVTATTVLVRTITRLGGMVSYRIPHRIKDGYSLKNYFLDELHELGVKIVITVDNGIAAAREIAYANDLGMDIIVTDHHTPPPADQMPQAYAIINPKIDTCEYPFKELSGSAVAMKLCLALISRNEQESDSREIFEDKLYQVAGIGTVADCMPLVGENRAITKIALSSLKKTPLRGVEELLHLAGKEALDIKAQDIGFVIGPRLNAAGRLDSAYDALHLFLNQSEKVKEVANKLHAMNSERREMTIQFFEEAKAQVVEEDLYEIVIVSSPHWNAGINGLVASRLVEEYARPVIVLSEKDGMLVGSCRSIEGFNMVEALRSVEDLLEHFGGHPMAAGLSIASEHYYEFVERMRQTAKLWLHDHDFLPTVHIDTTVSIDELTFENLALLDQLEPFGIGNEKPLFLLESVELLQVRTIGKTADHLSFSVGDIRCIAFGMGKYAELLQREQFAHVVGSLERNIWNGNTYLQFMVQDIALTNVKTQSESLVG